MLVLFPYDELSIMDYNRIVLDLSGNSEHEFIQKVSEKFTIKKHVIESTFPSEKRHTFGMYLNTSFLKA